MQGSVGMGLGQDGSGVGGGQQHFIQPVSVGMSRGGYANGQGTLSFSLYQTDNCC
jgi:hypothetical protein